MSKRVVLIVMDSFGIGEEPDAAAFGDVGTNTLKSCTSSSFFKAENLAKMGLLAIDGISTAKRLPEEKIKPTGTYARLRESSMGKDTTIGHWEIAGLISPEPLPTYPEGFPDEVIKEFEEKCQRGVLCNLPYSGTKVLIIELAIIPASIVPMPIPSIISVSCPICPFGNRLILIRPLLYSSAYFLKVVAAIPCGSVSLSVVVQAKSIS